MYLYDVLLNSYSEVGKDRLYIYLISHAGTQCKLLVFLTYVIPNSFPTPIFLQRFVIYMHIFPKLTQNPILNEKDSE